MSNSYRQILRSTSIIGGASVINILIGLLRTKVAAILLGPAGVGLIGLLQNLMATAAAVSSWGFGNVGTRQIAEAAGREDVAAIAAARRALFWGTLILAGIGGTVLWLLRAPLAERVLDDPGRASDVGWLALGVILGMVSGTQTALLNGLRRIGDLARVSVLSGVLGTVLGIAALWLWGSKGLLVFVLATPLSTFLVGMVYVSRLPKVGIARTPLPMLLDQWRVLAKLGGAFMAAGVITLVAQLLVRTLVQRELGSPALGQFQAAWTVSMTYLGVVLGAMSTDYYPRITAAIHDHAAVNRMVNEQTEVALLLAGPLLLGMLALAPWVIELLYSREFADAVVILRWQVLGDLLKIAAWPLAYIILAAGDGRGYMLTEAFAMAVFVGLVWIGLPIIGLQSTGFAFIGMYLALLPLVYWLAKRRTGFCWAPGVKRLVAVLVVAAIAVLAMERVSGTLAAVGGLTMALGFGMASLRRLAHMSDFGPITRIAALSNGLLRKTGLWRD